MRLIEWFMDRYRGTPGLFGRWVFRRDVRWMKKMARLAVRQRPLCWSRKFGPRMYCIYRMEVNDRCIYCGLPWEPMAPWQVALIEAGRTGKTH